MDILDERPALSAGFVIDGKLGAVDVLALGVERPGSRLLNLQYIVKRIMDIVLALAGLILLSPVFVVIGMAVKMTSPGPVFFVQERLAMGGRIFRLYKFRTMTDGAAYRVDEVLHLNGASGPLFKARHDPRVTAAGRLLRRTFLDELPQLLNILRGDMSFVGPRPCLPREAAKMQEDFAFRFRVPQGLTGPWQANGHHSLSFDDQKRVEREYVQSWSLARDAAILLRTVPHVLRAQGL